MFGRAAGDEQFFNLVYNEQHEPAADWFGNRGWLVSAVKR
jgi:hypothetical protein